MGASRAHELQQQAEQMFPGVQVRVGMCQLYSDETTSSKSWHSLKVYPLLVAIVNSRQETELGVLAYLPSAMFGKHDREITDEAVRLARLQFHHAVLAGIQIICWCCMYWANC